jgi:hypothetical protein
MRSVETVSKKMGRTLCIVSVAIAVLIPYGKVIAQSCEAGHWIADVTGDGQIIVLEDGSLWEVDLADTVTTSI